MDTKNKDKELIAQISPMRRYRNLLIALAAIASIFLVKWTGIDAGLIDDALRAGVDAVTAEPEPPKVYDLNGHVIDVDRDAPLNLSEEQGKNL